MIFLRENSNVMKSNNSMIFLSILLHSPLQYVRLKLHIQVIDKCFWLISWNCYYFLIGKKIIVLKLVEIAVALELRSAISHLLCLLACWPAVRHSRSNVFSYLLRNLPEIKKKKIHWNRINWYTQFFFVNLRYHYKMLDD